MDRKNIPNPGFADDDGTADPALSRALDRWSRGASAERPDPFADREVLAALRPSRLMVPIVALLGEVETDERGLRHEKTSDMAVPVIEAADGRRALPAFTSLEALARWRADARPAPVAAPQAVLAAYAERADTLLIDPAGPVTYRLSGARMRAVAENREYLPPPADPEVREAVRRVLAAEPAVDAGYLGAGGEGDGTLALVLAPDTAEGELRGTVDRLVAALVGDPVLRVRLDRGLELALLRAELPQEPLYRR
ncbi:SseB family protein [Kitasatospora sp. NBC_00240]|uniref:SseB family protein n=1 Tax=Kitasatospora sp. NBC_00240 TaxID=2903567 RepID=UPI00224F67E1|nr:SseB family protein [Kitasatospora sp. NBC_00240]MCX5209289.1 SseB family protein [Kitasatospora sp. NBC_00240]